MSDRVLIVEDRDNLRALYARVLGDAFTVDEAPDGTTALGLLASAAYAVVVTDVRLPGAGGEAVLAEARRQQPPPEVVLVTAYAEVPAAVAALKAGAYDYLAKPVQPDDLLRVVRRAAERQALVRRARELETLLVEREGGLVAQSASMRATLHTVERVGPLPVPVLVVGERGTGKEQIARELHRVYGKGAFVPVSCGALPEGTLRAELPGLLERARGGVLFLDDVDALSPALQVDLARSLEDGEARIVAATERDPGEGRIREELLYRLKVVQLALPPLRERREDLPLLCARFLTLASSRLGTPARKLSPDALAALEGAPWPGNLRELRHALEHAAVLAAGEVIEVTDLPEELRVAAPPTRAGTYREAVERAQERAAREYLAAVLQRHGGNVTRAAEEAGVERETMHRLIRRHGLAATRFREGA